MNCLTLAFKNMNVMDVSREQLIMFQIGNMIISRQSCICIIKFQNVQTTERHDL